jgi:hypothetical protein
MDAGKGMGTVGAAMVVIGLLLLVLLLSLQVVPASFSRALLLTVGGTVIFTSGDVDTAAFFLLATRPLFRTLTKSLIFAGSAIKVNNYQSFSKRMQLLRYHDNNLLIICDFTITRSLTGDNTM